MDLEHFRTLLLARRETLLTDADTDAAATVELDQTRQGRLSRMDARQQQAMAAATGQRRTAELARIDATLARSESGDYGLCLGCDEEIAPARLEIDPAATRCLLIRPKPAAGSRRSQQPAGCRRSRSAPPRSAQV